jgi:N-methylhydantoinase A/oxoprolinase/acetone carboxylase beta subunit
MSTRVLACGVFRTDLESLVQNYSQDIQITYLEGGLHSEPARLRSSLQEAIDTEAETSRIILLFGLCGTGTSGLHARKIPLVIPRVHDCISLFLGSSAAYAEQFRHTPGTYYISAGWYEEQVQPRAAKPDKSEKDPSRETIRLNISQDVPEDLVLIYGRENAEAILDVTHSWKRNYKRAVFIDTGNGNREKYRNHVKAIGKEFGWKTETLPGSTHLIEKALTVKETDEDILVVKPGQLTYFDVSAGKLSAGEPDASDLGYSPHRRSWIIPGIRGTAGHRQRRIGLGIDAGGTYTDTVLFDLQKETVLAKSKALTTPWEYTEGIDRALEQLPAGTLIRTEIVSVSTTLATNAIVENNQQTVGLLLMPLAEAVAGEIDHRPVKLIRGRMSITGEVLEDIDEAEIRQSAREMVQNQGVRAFAVSGYGGTVNPAHEQKVAGILRDETGLMVCAGHELSGHLDFTVRAATAVLNAGIIPHLETFFHAVEDRLKSRGINAPVLFVRGDGFLMNSSYAMEHPIETALSGPAASIAGARYLSNCDEACIIDVGGTTSDIAYIQNGSVETDPDGAMIGPHRTHVQAVDMVTLGMGGDSEVIFDRGDISVGPRRVTPLCRLGIKGGKLLKDLSAKIDALDASSSAALICRYTGKKPPFQPNRIEEAMLRSLESGPLSVLELAERAGLGHWRFLKLNRLLSVRSVEVLGLTPTDLLHVDGRLKLGSKKTARLGLQLHSRLSGIPEKEYARRVWSRAEESISTGIMAKLLDLPASDPAINLLVRGGSKRVALSVKPTAPLIGLGAAAPFLLGGILRSLGQKAQIPENADVANAIGAVTSSVRAYAAGSVIPAAPEGYRLTGSYGTIYTELNQAEAGLEDRLLKEVREKAAAAGTSETEVRLSVWDRTACSATGEVVLLERCMHAEIRGLPDRF